MVALDGSRDLCGDGTAGAHSYAQYLLIIHLMRVIDDGERSSCAALPLLSRN